MGNVTYSFRSTSATTVLASTDLSGLADTARKVSAAQTNTSSGMLFARVEWNQAATTAGTTSGGSAKLYLLASVDDTNFAKGSTGAAADAGDQVASFTASSVAQVQVTDEIRLPPNDFKWLLQNDFGVALSTGTNTVKAVYYTENIST